MGERAERQPSPGIPWGVTEKNLVAYTQAALAKFIREVRGTDGLQFRMHQESGLKRAEMAAFWGSLFDIVKQTAPAIRCDLRAKGLPDSIIDAATGVPSIKTLSRLGRFRSGERSMTCVWDKLSHRSPVRPLSGPRSQTCV